MQFANIFFQSGSFFIILLIGRVIFAEIIKSLINSHNDFP